MAKAKSPHIKTSATPRVKKELSLSEARKRTELNPDDLQAWKRYGKLLADAGNHGNAALAFKRAIELEAENPFLHSALANSYHRSNNPQAAREHLDRALALDKDHVQALVIYGLMEQDIRQHQKALAYFERAELLTPHDLQLLRSKAVCLSSLSRYDEALIILEHLISKYPDDFGLWNDAANIRRDLGDFDGLDQYYHKAIELAGDNPVPYSNRLTYLHYDPNFSRKSIFEACCEWQERYAPKEPPPRPVPSNLDPTRRLRLGLFSDGFRMHPVGTMIVEALARLSPQDVELFLYPSHSDEDALTARLKSISHHWSPIKHVKGKAFAEKIRSDEIDILIDLSGHNSGTRSGTVALQPAPISVKWVGGLINTTGIKAMDYLISDHIETPPNDEEDSFYVEKLIRLPDDYIVFSPPAHAPATGPLPALTNGYITLGCFNNPTKINRETLVEWAKLMKQLPDSRLLLKGRPYTSDSFRQRIIDLMAEEGIEESRLIIEGPAHHVGLLEAYNRVDIALDPWPYSGGLTTCEAMMMGVPVVTLPGPTFAGRHSATHLVNAGMPELVTNTWDEYRERVHELVSDLDSLSTIRKHLRDILLQSPVCDGARLAQNLMKSLRAIWQRYCEGKAPQTLTFNKEGQAWFKGELDPVDVEVTPPTRDPVRDGFTWGLQGQIVAIDSSSKLLRNRSLGMLLKTKAFAVVAFDPRSLIKHPEQYQNHDYIQLVPHALLGDGKPSTLYACLDPEMSSTLKPLPEDQLPQDLHQGIQVLTELPINTIALNSIEGLENLDWLILDDLSDIPEILEHGTKALANTLVIEAKVAFQHTHFRQASLDEISHWASRNGFRFYHLGKMGHRTHLPSRDNLKKRQSTELVTAEALFIPDQARLANLPAEQRIKLAFILHTIYGIRDFTYRILSSIDEELGETYLIAEGIVKNPLADDQDRSNLTPVGTMKGIDFAATLTKVERPKPAAPKEIKIPDAPFMTEEEQALFRKSLSNAKRYFEFGSGGSTVWAVEQGLTVFGVESDRQWVDALKAKLGERCCVETVDIGPTKEWGFPASTANRDKFPGYSKAIQQHEQPFDLILVDGRFRVASTMTAIMHVMDRMENPGEARLFLHDFWNRSHYHVVLEFLELIEQVGTAGVFRIKDGVDRKKVDAMWEQYAREPS